MKTQEHTPISAPAIAPADTPASAGANTPANTPTGASANTPANTPTGTSATAPTTAPTNAPTAAPVILEARDFGFAYAGAAPLFSALNAQVRRGDFVVLVGPTGCGKTTFLRCCVPALRPAGTLSGTLIAEACGYVAQEPAAQIVCDTVRAELAFGLQQAGVNRDEAALRIAEVAHFFAIGPWIRSRTADLSGGQRQLLNVAAALALRPACLLLDEPASQLDPVAQKAFVHALFRANREAGVTVVVATHCPDIYADYATRVLVFEAGNLVERVPSDFAAGTVLNFAPRERGTDFKADSAPAPIASHVFPSEPAYRMAATPSAITLKNLYAAYDRKAPYVLRGINLEVASGTIRALVGGNGSGKTTLLEVVAGVGPAHAGVVKNHLRTNTGYVPQEPKALFLYDTVAEEVGERVAESYGLPAATHPYDLSGGQQQLLAFAKVSAAEPALLLLDEPTKGLDASEKLRLAEALIAARRRGATVLFATHDRGFAAAVADEISLLFDGEIVLTAPTEDFFAHTFFYNVREDEFLRRWKMQNEAVANEEVNHEQKRNVRC